MEMYIMKYIRDIAGIVCFTLCFAQGCTEAPRGTNGGADTGRGLDMRVICRFVKQEEDKDAPLRIGIACMSRVPIHADIGYRTGGSGPVWTPIQTNVASEKLKDDTYVVRCLWEKPPGVKRNIYVKVTAVSKDGTKGNRTVRVDCVRPKSRVTFDPFSL